MAAKVQHDENTIVIELENRMKKHRAFGNPEWVKQKNCFDSSLSRLDRIIFSFDDFRYKWSTDDFELGCRLGRGKFGRVYVAREKQTHFMVALKVLYKSEVIKGRVEKKIAHEIEIHSRLR